jgi:hypothetical protein
MLLEGAFTRLVGEAQLDAEGAIAQRNAVARF